MPRLFVDEITSVGAVDAGDDPEAHIMFFKRKAADGPDPESADSAELEKEKPTMDFDLSALDEATRSQVTEHIAALEAKAALVPEEELSKAVEMPPEAEAILKAKDDEVAQLRKDLTAEVQKRRDAEFNKRAEQLIPLLGKPGDIGPILEELERNAPDAYAKLEPLLAAGANVARSSDLFKEFGSGEAESDPIAKRDAWVAKQREDEKETRTDAELAAAFWADNPDERAALRGK
jgi:hypothetical protein